MDRSVDTVSSPHSSPQCNNPESIKRSVAYPNGSSISVPPRRSLTDYVLYFFSTASNEAIIAAFVCLAAVTVVLLGRLGLLLIGFAAGVILHASWGEIGPQSEDRATRSELTRRLLDWPEKEFGDNRTLQHAAPSRRSSRIVMDYSSLPPETAAALNSLTDAIVGDYVKYWYTPILPLETSFPDSCQRTLTAFIASMSSHLSRKQPTDTFLQFLTNSSSMIIVFLNELSTALAAGMSVSSTPEDAISKYLQQNPDSSLANVLAVEQQRKKLNMVADDMLSGFLDAAVYSCEPVRHFLREILAGVVLEAVIKTCSSPQFINSWIVYLLEEGEPELMNAIDAGVEGARKDGSVATTSAPVDEQIRIMSPGERLNSGPLPSSNSNLEYTQQGDARTDKVNDMSCSREAPVIGDVSGKAKKDLSDGSGDPHYTISNEATPSSLSDSDGFKEPSRGDRKESTVSTDDSRGDSQQTSNKGDFTNFDQLLSSKPINSLQVQQTTPPAEQPPPLTLHSASVSIDDLSESGDKGLIRARPSGDYALQIEPASSRYPGWIVFRKYSDFESLHEALGPISRLNQIHSFLEHHPVLPTWKGKSKQAFKQDLENYLRDALRHETLAESERMRRFLGKDRNLDAVPKAPLKSGFSFPGQTAFEGMGKGVLDVLASAPKGVAGSSKAVFGGVTGVFGSVSGNKKLSTSGTGRQGLAPTADSNSAARSVDGHIDKILENNGRLSSSTFSPESNTATGPGKSTLPMDRKRHTLQSLPPSSQECSGVDWKKQPGSDPKCDNTSQDTFATSDRNELKEEEQAVAYSRSSGTISLPPKQDHTGSLSGSIDPPNPDNPSPASSFSTASASRSSPSQGTIKTDGGGTASPLTSEEARMAVELIFAVINELYTLSSAWNIRKTLLNAAKSYILRPGNPNLEAIRVLLQQSVIEAYTTDEALAAQIRKLRENCLPTEDELRKWPPPPDDSEQERLRNTARKLLVERGMPQALVSVMGAAATGEALGKVFDCLQIEVVARGFIFALLLQALKTATL